MSKKNEEQQQETQGMDFLQSLPRRWVTTYIPLAIFVFVLLFPFYWMVITAVKPDNELLRQTGNPFWVVAPTLAHFKKLLFETVSGLAAQHRHRLGRLDFYLTGRQRDGRLCD